MELPPEGTWLGIEMDEPKFERQFKTYPCKFAKTHDDCDKTVERSNFLGTRKHFVCFACKERQNKERAKKQLARIKALKK